MGKSAVSKFFTHRETKAQSRALIAPAILVLLWVNVMAEIKPNLVDMRKSQGKMEMEHGKMDMGEMPDMYPNGLCIHLEKEQIDALGLEEMPEPGEKYKVLAVGVVTKSEMAADGKSPMVGLQLTALQLIPEDDDEAKEPKRTPNPMTVLSNAYPRHG